MTDKLREAAQQAERGCDPITITRLAALVDEETQRILADSLSLIEQIKYMVGIAERGTGRKCPDDECPEAFLLAYVKSLEAALAQQDAQTNHCPTCKRTDGDMCDWCPSMQQDAQAVPKPIGYTRPFDLEALQNPANPTVSLVVARDAFGFCTAPIYAAPTPPAQRVTLTDDEVELASMKGDGTHAGFARAIIEVYEKKNGIK